MSEKPATATADGGEGGATGNSEGGTTVVFQKKRLRRVSFAEMTSIHFFDRDDDNEAPAEEGAVKGSEDSNDANEREEKSDLLGFRELLDSRSGEEEEDREDGDGDSEDEELATMRRSFLRPAESPSPGSTFGSATSNDEDDFFGPVSSSFIRPGNLSDSAASNDNHDVTMDSTAFSMHFRSLARSDSGVELKTPTGLHLSFEEKTPTHTNAGSSMELTVPKKPSSQSSPPAGNSGSSDMSLVGDKSSKYDYGRISPGLDALLAESSKNLHATSAADVTVASKSPRHLESKSFPPNENGSGLKDVIHNGKAVSSLDNSFDEANGCSTFIISHSASDFSSNPLATDILIEYSNSSPRHLSKTRTSPSHPDKLGPEDKYIQHESPLAELASPSPANGRQIVATSTSPAPYISLLTPQDDRGSLLINENVEHRESAPSIQKSISKLKLLEASPFSSYLTAKIENSTAGVLNFSSHSPFSKFSEGAINDYQIQYLDSSTTVREGQPLDAFQKQDVLHASATVDNQIGDPLDGGHMIHSEGTMTAAASPLEFIWSEKKMKHDLFRSRRPREKELLTTGTGADSSWAEIALDHVGDRKTVFTPEKIVSPPNKELAKKWTSPKLQGQMSNDLMLHDRLMRLKTIFPGQESASKGGINDSGISAVSLDELDSFSMGRKVQPSLPVDGFNNSNLIEFSHQNQQSTSEIIESLRTPTKAKDHFICPKKLDWGPQTGKELRDFEGGHSGGESEIALPSVGRSLKELTLQKDHVGGFTKSPSHKEFQESNDNISLSSVEDVLSPSSNKSGSLSRKRSNEMVEVEDRSHTNGLTAFQRSSKLQKVGNHDLKTRGCPNEDGAETSATAHELKHWTEIYSRFFQDPENMLSPAMDKLNCLVIESLDNILFNLQRSKTYGILHSEIFAQKTSIIDDLRRQRVSEARSLLLQIIHEKAKLQLMSVKRQKLQEKVQQLSSGIQESQMLKLKFMHGCKGDAQADATAVHQTLVNSRHREEVVCDKVTAMKQNLETLDKKTTKLMKSLTTACKVEGEPSCANSITAVTNHLMKRSRCQLVRFNMQVWIIDDVERKNGHRDIVLNYLDFIIQRLKVPIPPASSMAISLKLEDVKITANFPNMDACVAFSFVFNAENSRTYSCSRSLAQEIQVTSSILGNLVDVVQEVRLARIELRHLTRTTFHCPLVGQLYLELGFLSFERGEKVILTLDLSSLKWGIYPSEILPSQLKVIYGAKSLMAAPLLDEIRDALKSLRAGYMRILRLCRRVSQIIQVSRQ